MDNSSLSTHLAGGMIESNAQVIALPQAGSPFNPEWRIYARSSGDDKAPLIAILAALQSKQQA
jgi:hypothetical protein